MKKSTFISCVAAQLLACPFAFAQDECATAPTLVSGVASAFDTATATVTALPVVTDELCATTDLVWVATQQDVWFQWTPTANGIADFSTCNSASYDTSIVIYSGSCATLTPVACNGDGSGLTGCQAFYSLVSQLPVAAGTTYYVRIGGYDGETGPGTITVTFTEGVEGCAGATGACDAVHPTAGCADFACCNLVCGVFPDCCSTGWDQTCVDLVYTECTGYFLYSCVNPVPANDCATSPTLISGDSVVAFNNTNANNDGPGFGDDCPSGGSGNNESNHDVWYRLNAVANGDFFVSTCGQMLFDSKIAIYDLGTNPSTFNYNSLPLARIDCNDAGPGNCVNETSDGSELTVVVQAGRTYLVCLAGFAQTDFGAGTITFNVPEPCVLSPATAAEAEPCGQNLNGGCNSEPPAFETVFVGATVEGTFYVDPGDPTAVPPVPATRDTDWYTFSIPADRTITANLRSASLTQLFIFGEGCPAVVLASGEGSCPGTASICLSAGTYSVVVAPTFVDTAISCSDGVLNRYTLELTGVVPTTPCPTIVTTSCTNPGPNDYASQGATAVTGGLVACAVNPAFPNCNGGGTTVNSYARVIPAGNAFASINCLGIGFFSVVRDVNAANNACVSYLSDIPLPARIGIYRDINNGAPTNAFLPDGTCPTGDCDLQLITFKDVLVPGMSGIGQVEFDPPLCLETETQNIVVTMELASLFDGVTGVPPASGYGLRAAGAAVAGQSSNTYLKLSCANPSGAYQTAESAGASFTAQWIVNVNGTSTSCPSSSCTGDMNADNVVNGADLGLLLGAWGSCAGCIQDINQDGVVNGADLGLLLGAWGPCP